MRREVICAAAVSTYGGLIWRPSFLVRSMANIKSGISCSILCPGIHSFPTYRLADVEEFRNSHGGAVADAGAGTGSSYLSYSNCDMFKLTL